MKKQKSGPEKQNDDLPGYPIYPSDEDIYSRAKKESELDPENPANRKKADEETGTLNEKNFRDDVSGGDLDVPGSELDDAQEQIGSEDEENNLYSLGGDNHEAQEEDNTQ
ncbi:MAG: hypothetical protein JNL60_06285 [Bacteroidia bacterium]|nr:hypothetical protein [Bacteroidia bacterium]